MRSDDCLTHNNEEEEEEEETAPKTCFKSFDSFQPRPAQCFRSTVRILEEECRRRQAPVWTLWAGPSSKLESNPRGRPPHVLQKMVVKQFTLE
jgi:hypothetical protein